MPKRKLTGEDKDRLTKALSARGASERAVHSIFNIFHEGERSSLSRGAFMKVVEDKYDPWKQATQPLKLECHDGSFVEIPMGNLSEILKNMCAAAPDFRSVLQKLCKEDNVSIPFSTVTNRQLATCWLSTKAARPTSFTFHGCSVGIY